MNWIFFFEQIFQLLKISDGSDGLEKANRLEKFGFNLCGFHKVACLIASAW